MGCILPSEFDDTYESDEFECWREQFFVLYLKKREIRQLYRIFTMVANHSADNANARGLLGQEVGLPELFGVMSIDRTKFTERVFSILDEDGSEKLDFREFVLALWNFCTLSGHSLETFAFNLYDDDESGVLSAKEMQEMLKDIYGGSGDLHREKVRIITNDLKDMEKENKLFDLGRFRSYIRSHQAMILPLFQLQLNLRENIIGPSFWMRSMQHRDDLMNNNKLCPIEDLIEGEMISKGWILRTVDEDGRKVKRYFRTDRVYSSSGSGGSNGSLQQESKDYPNKTRAEMQLFEAVINSTMTDSSHSLPRKSFDKGSSSSPQRTPRRGSLSPKASRENVLTSTAAAASGSNSPNRTPRRGSTTATSAAAAATATSASNGKRMKETNKSPRPPQQQQRDGSLSPGRSPRRGSVAEKKSSSGDVLAMAATAAAAAGKAPRDGPGSPNRSPRRGSVANSSGSDVLAAVRETRKSPREGAAASALTSIAAAPSVGATSAAAVGVVGSRSPRRGSMAPMGIDDSKKSPRRNSTTLVVPYPVTNEIGWVFDELDEELEDKKKPNAAAAGMLKASDRALKHGGSGF